MRHLIYILLMALPLTFTACNDDDVDFPSDSAIDIDFPQGDNDYDKDFVEFKNTYGSMVLYRFTEAQFRWAINDYIPYYGTVGDEQYVKNGWDMIRQGLDVWPEDFMKSCLPYSILLADSVYQLKDGYDSEWHSIKIKETRNSCYGYNHMAFAVVNDRVGTMTADRRKEFVGDVAYALIGYATSKSRIAIPEAFDTLYTKWHNNYSPGYEGAWGYNGAGALDNTATIYNYTLYHDFATYVKYMVMMSAESFEQRFLNDTFDCGGSEYDENWNIIPEHRIRQKYEAVRDYFIDELGIDLGQIGARTEQMQ